MKHPNSKQISLVIALFFAIIALSACSSQTTPTQSSTNNTGTVNYSQNASTSTTQTSNIPSPQTRQS